jgi:type I restriction enzyme S subunit
MRKYQSYKPSSIEWLDEIPENWEKSKLKYLGTLYGGLTGKSGVDFNNDDNPKNKPYIPYTNIYNNTYISKNHYHYVSIDDGENQNKVEKYDMFFLMSSETHKDLGKSCILIDDVDELYLNSFCKGFRIKDRNVQPLFLNYQILGHLHREMISVEGKGFTRINLRQDKINDLVVFFPPLSEQEQIVKYLDEKTSIIDKLISTKERKIELLKEQRTSLINEVITKGLNPNVKMKDSGVEWIGKIPDGWGISKVKYISEIFGRIGYRGYTIQDIVSEEEGVITISPSNIKNDIFTIEGDNTYISYEKYYQSPEIMIKSEDIILVKTGSTIGKTSIIPRNVPEMTINPQLVVVKNIKIHNKFLYYQTTCDFIKKSFLVEQTGSSTPTISQEKINNFPILIPSNQEQEQIVDYLDKHIKEIDDLVSMEQRKIELLKEYRQSLISEVITGKIKVVE